ncbi:MAG: NmrA family transcriptional regulator [Ilumatobacteraceae bacterium]
MHTARPTLILGGTGKTGRRVASRLGARHLAVRIGSRVGDPPFDWTDRSTWPAAVAGVGAVYVTYVPDIAFPGAVEDIAAFADLAVRSGVERLVLLSGRGEDGALAGERAVQEAGAEWTVVRASWFAQNFSEHFLTDAIIGGELALPVGDVGEPFIDADDIADVAVAALTTDDHVGRIHEVTGPRLLTFADATAEIAAASGRAIRFVAIPPDAFTTALVDAGLPVDEAIGITGLFTTVLDGRNASVTDGVEAALGRPARDFTDWARSTAATGVWTGAPMGVTS